MQQRQQRHSLTAASEQHGRPSAQQRVAHSGTWRRKTASDSGFLLWGKLFLFTATFRFCGWGNQKPLYMGTFFFFIHLKVCFLFFSLSTSYTEQHGYQTFRVQWLASRTVAINWGLLWYCQATSHLLLPRLSVFLAAVNQNTLKLIKTKRFSRVLTRLYVCWECMYFSCAVLS